MLKTDDDCYVKVPKLVELVQQLERRSGRGMLYVGRQVQPALLHGTPKVSVLARTMCEVADLDGQHCLTVRVP